MVKFKHNHVIIISICILFLWACKPGKDIPPDVIGMEEMKSILLDMQMADVYANDMLHDSTYQKNKEVHLKTYYQQILKLHHIKKEYFLKSYHFYESRPDLLNDIYNEMSDEVKAQKQRADTTYRPKPVP